MCPLVRIKSTSNFNSPRLRPPSKDESSPRRKSSVCSGTVVLYPAGYYTSRILVRSDLKLPAGWQFGTALEVVSHSADRVEFAPTSLDTLVDSPLFAGRHYKRVDLDPAAAVPVYANIVADNPLKLEIKPEQLAAYRKLMKEAYVLYGTRSFDRYDFLLALTENLSA